MRHWRAFLGVTLLMIGLCPVALPVISETIAAQIDGCAANEAGSIGCMVGTRDYGPALAAPYRLLPYVPLGFVVALGGLGFLIAAWSGRRAADRRAKHR